MQIQRRALEGRGNSGFIGLLSLLVMMFAGSAKAESVLSLDVLGEAFTVQQFPAAGRQLVLYVAPGYGFNQRGMATAQALADLGIEVWMVDLAENLFLPISNDTSHTFDGRYVASILEQAHERTGKNITLLTSSFGAIAVLRGARQWQLNNPGLKQAYLNGAILFSPELYKAIPALGKDPEFEPITSATNIPIMLYQSELRNNRWQLDNVVHQLEQGDAVVYQKILPGIVSFFYEIDEFPQTLKILRELPAEIPRIISLLQATPTPLSAVELAEAEITARKGLDIKLKPYKGNKKPLPLDLQNIKGERVVRTHFRGKVTVVNFWATWCPPCVEEIPMLNRLRSKMNGNDFELISINFGEEKATIEAFLKKVNVEFPVLLDEKGRTSGHWNTVVLPSTYVIGPDGKFAYAVNAAIEWDSPEVVEAIRILSGKQVD
jgi:thiol-disulfide isomerase/thioredoxin